MSRKKQATQREMVKHIAIVSMVFQQKMMLYSKRKHLVAAVSFGTVCCMTTIPCIKRSVKFPLIHLLIIKIWMSVNGCVKSTRLPWQMSNGILRLRFAVSLTGYPDTRGSKAKSIAKDPILRMQSIAVEAAISNWTRRRVV